MRKIFITIIFFIGLSISCSYAGTLEDAHSAYDKGDYKTAYKLLLTEAKKGNPLAQNNLGNMYVDGKGVSRDYKEAFKWYKLAAQQGYAGAQYNLGVMYQDGTGVLQDYKEAVKWYGLAEGQGIAAAKCNLAEIYAAGSGIKKDIKTAGRLAKEGLDAGEQYCGEVRKKYKLAN
jgi:TPR repeat protein